MLYKWIKQKWIKSNCGQDVRFYNWLHLCWVITECNHCWIKSVCRQTEQIKCDTDWCRFKNINIKISLSRQTFSVFKSIILDYKPQKRLRLSSWFYFWKSDVRKFDCGRTFVSSNSLLQWVTNSHLFPTLAILSCQERKKLGYSDE